MQEVEYSNLDENEDYEQFFDYEEDSDFYDEDDLDEFLDGRVRFWYNSIRRGSKGIDLKDNKNRRKALATKDSVP